MALSDTRALPTILVAHVVLGTCRMCRRAFPRESEGLNAGVLVDDLHSS